MKLSKLRALCDKAIEKYGDMEVGAFDSDYAYDVDYPSDINSFKLRVINSAASDLPGQSLDEEEGDGQGKSSSYFACIFYES